MKKPTLRTTPGGACCPEDVSRRDFVAISAATGCAAWISGAAAFLSPAALRAWSGNERDAGRAGATARRQQIVAQTPFARIEDLGDGLFAIVSTPLEGDYTTVCNGGIIGGPAGTIVVESFATPEGGKWAAEQARALTGRWPTHLIVSHYHGDHSAGAAGFAEESEAAPSLWATAITKDLVQNGRADAAAKAPWADVVLVPEDGPTTIDLGDRLVSIVPRRGHTASDLTLEVRGGSGQAGGGAGNDDPHTVWCGDLVWNAMFPNFMDATPSQLMREVRQLSGSGATTFVPGHGPLAGADAMSRYVALLASVEEAAREGWQRGMSADEVAERYEVPAGLGSWVMFNPNYYLRAIQAWMGEMG